MKQWKDTIDNFLDEFIDMFHQMCKEKGFGVPELTDNVLTEILTTYFDKKTLSEANKYFHDVLDEKVPDSYETIDWSLERPAVEETPEYKAWRRRCEIDTIMYDCKRILNCEKTWVNINGKAHTEDEAARIAADKWCELIFGWHLQDNGALNETHGGGFPACALGTILSEVSKKNLTDEMKMKAHQLLKDYYIHDLHFAKTNDMEDLDWLNKTLPTNESQNFNWNYGFYELSCDYGPSWPLYMILYHAGVPEKDIENICPWKTSIRIRREDNTVMYRTYQHCDEL